MAARSPEARKVLRELNKELASAGTRSGQSLVWSASEAAILGQIATILDRKHDFLAAYAAAGEIEVQLKISAELRLLEQAAARLVRLVKTDLAAAPESSATIKARRAARVRWDRDASSS